MERIFVGLALSSTMFKGEAVIFRSPLTAEKAAEVMNGDNIVSCVNPSHQATIDALREKFGIDLPIPEKAPMVTLETGDSLIVLSARFSRRLSEGEKYSPEEVEQATFEFTAYYVVDQEDLTIDGLAAPVRYHAPKWLRPEV